MNAGDTKRTRFGLAHWMQQVVEECDKVGGSFAADPVHDLRVAIRRCRSMADGLMTVDSHPAWKEMKKAGKQVFAPLGDLRDAQVMAGWIQRLGSADDLVTKSLFDFTVAREHALKQDAFSALDAFDRKEWKNWSELLPARAQRVRPDSMVFRHLALERWQAAYLLHQRAMRNRSKAALHQLRIGLKKFRYIVENFLPGLHEQWSNSLKELQDLLGEIHDLDVLRATALQIRVFLDTESRARWLKQIETERAKRLGKYRKKMLGKDSLWQVWRARLPQGSQVEAAALERLKTWASFLDPDFSHARHVTRLALQLYDKLPANGFVRKVDSKRARSILQAAALMHDVGRAKREKKHQKSSFRLIRRLSPPLGWRPLDLQMAGVVARHHRGSVPQLAAGTMAELTETQKRTAIFLAGILRLADALDRRRDARVQGLQVQDAGSFLTVWTQGQPLEGRQLEAVARARHLLEVVYDRPVLVRSRLPGLLQALRQVAGQTHAAKSA